MNISICRGRHHLDGQDHSLLLAEGQDPDHLVAEHQEGQEVLQGKQETLRPHLPHRRPEYQQWKKRLGNLSQGEQSQG